MLKWEKDTWYQFKPGCDVPFIKANGANDEIHQWIEESGGSFKVTSVVGSCATHAENTDGEQAPGMFHMFESELNFFEEVSDGKNWEVGGIYRCFDLNSLLRRSAINKSFCDKVGNSEFTVERMDYVTIPRVTKISYKNVFGSKVEMNFALIKSELPLFERVAPGQPYVSLDESAKSLEEEMESIPETSAPFAEIEGALVLRIEDEADRIRALEFLNKSKWKN